MIDYQFVTFDLLTYFNSDFTLMCRTIYCLVLSLSSNTHLWIVCEHFNLHVNFWPIDLIKYSAQRLNFPWKFSCLVMFFFQIRYQKDTYSFSRIVNYTCFAVTQVYNRMAALCIFGYWQVIIPQSQISQMSTNCINIIGLCVLNFVPFLM